jgi:hypothetical protein
MREEKRPQTINPLPEPTADGLPLENLQWDPTLYMSIRDVEAVTVEVDGKPQRMVRTTFDVTCRGTIYQDRPAAEGETIERPNSFARPSAELVESLKRMNDPKMP